MKNNELVKRNSTAISRMASILELRNQILNLEEPIQQGDYNCFVCRRNPNCYILIVDQSENTVEEFEKICELINDFIQDVIFQCARESEIREYIKIYLVPHYNATSECINEGSLNAIWKTPLETRILNKKEMMPWGEVIDTTTTQKIWITAKSEGNPNLNKALNIAYDIAKEHIAQYSKCFPPIVYNVSTINQAISLHEQESVYKIKGLKNEIGNVLFANVNVINKDEKPSIENSNYEFKSKLASYFVKDLYTTKIGFYTSSAHLKMLDIRMNLFNEMVLVLNQGSYFMDDEIVQQMKNLKQEYE